MRIDHYEVCLPADQRQPVAGLDNSLVSFTSYTDLTRWIDRLAHAYRGAVEVRALVAGRHCPVDEDGNALDPSDEHIIANAL
ncbi:MAG: hypothetical protein HYR63_12840 [Proteobacteria bacterium]|nr:hypothetical protein [Pseudomonadota bacterium]MBI3497017.1 hypothetical protein [Pseudomonadota bacterium]